MFRETRAFSSFAVNDVPRAKEFYSETLGLDVIEENDMLTLNLAGGCRVLVYPKPDHVPATFTILNFPVGDIDRAIDDLVARGVTFERYPQFKQNEKGIAQDAGPPIAWFTDPAGNVLAVMQP